MRVDAGRALFFLLALAAGCGGPRRPVRRMQAQPPAPVAQAQQPDARPSTVKIMFCDTISSATISEIIASSRAVAENSGPQPGWSFSGPVLSALLADATAFAAIRALAEQGLLEIVASPYRQVDLEILESVCDLEEVRHQVARGAELARRLSGRTPDGILIYRPGFTPAVAQMMRKLGFKWAVFAGNFDGGLAPPISATPEMSGGMDRSMAAIAVLPSRISDGGIMVAPSFDADGTPAPGAALREIYRDALSRFSEGPSWIDYSTGTVLSAEALEMADELSGALAALRRYRDSGRARIDKLDSAWDELSHAEEAARFHERPTTEIRKWFRASLANVYRIVDMPPPSEGSRRPASSAHGPLAPQVPAENTEYEAFFENSASGEIPRDGWRMRALGVGRGEKQRLVFDVWLAGSPLPPVVSAVPDDRQGAAAAPAAIAARPPEIAVFIDQNNIPDAGCTEIFDPSLPALVSDDAWEYAVIAYSSGAYVLQATPEGRPETVCSASFKFAAPDHVRISIADGQIRGDPANWGYLALARWKGFPPDVICGEETPDDMRMIRSSAGGPR